MKSNYSTGTKMKKAGQGTTSFQVMTVNHMTNPAFLCFVLASANASLNALGFFFRKFAIIFSILRLFVGA